MTVEELKKQAIENWNKSLGTPTTLMGAINNAVMAAPDGDSLEVRLKNHVKDYLSQQFQKAQLKAESDSVSWALESLWERIIKDDK